MFSISSKSNAFDKKITSIYKHVVAYLMHLRLINYDSAIHVTACAQQFGDLGISVYLFMNATWPFDLYLQ